MRRQTTGSLAIQVCLLAVAINLLGRKRLAIGALGWRLLPDAAAIEWIGAALTLAGLAFAVWARFYLGRNWSGSVTVKQGHQLIRSGPYAMVRHPMYSGLTLAVLGAAIAIGQVKGLAGFLIVLLAWKQKSLIEERFMIEQFGAEYQRYRREVKWLIPYVW